MRHLRVIGGIADLHRSTTTDEGEPSLSRTTKMVPERGAAIPEAPRRAWGRYQLREKVGEGSYGSVYRAWYPDLEREIAIKILHKLDTPDAVQRFERERRLLGSLGEAQGFVPLLEAGTSPHGPFIVMPLLRGGTLRDRLAA